MLTLASPDVDVLDVSRNTRPRRDSNDKRLNANYLRYAAWLDKHFSRIDDVVETTCRLHERSGEQGVDAFSQRDSETTLFRAWCTRGFQPKEISARLHNTLGGRDGTLFKKYEAWLKTHFSAKA